MCTRLSLLRPLSALLLVLPGRDVPTTAQCQRLSLHDGGGAVFTATCEHPAHIGEAP
jgi:hypothetical protein